MKGPLFMFDKLQRCAIAFSELLNVQYNIILGRKGQLINITLGFDETHFVHLAGLHKLTDNDFFRTASRKKVFDAALSGNISYETVVKSSNFHEIKDRIEYFEFLEDMLDDNNIIFRYNSKRNVFSLIQADYLMQSQYNLCDVYIFIDKVKNSNTHFCRSFFPKSNKDYTAGQAKYTLLYKEKINLKTGEGIVQYDKISK